MLLRKLPPVIRRDTAKLPRATLVHLRSCLNIFPAIAAVLFFSSVPQEKAG